MQRNNITEALKGALAMLPLSIAVLPWGVLAGSLAVEAGLLNFQAQAVSLFVFAGSVQLVGMALIKASASLSLLLLTTLFLTSRHLLYSVAMRPHISQLPLSKRIILGFLLTDELFAVVAHKKPENFSFYYAFGAGFSFYLMWQLASFGGIYLGQSIPNLDQYGLDFAVVATFIAIVVPQIKKISTLITVLASMVLSVVFHLVQVEGALVIASLISMALGYFVSHYLKEPLTEDKN